MEWLCGRKVWTSSMVQGLATPGVVYEVLRVDAKGPVEKLLVLDASDAGQVKGPVALQPAGRARPYAPDVREGAVVPDAAPEGLLVKPADAVWLALGQHVQRHLGPGRGWCPPPPWRRCAALV